MMSWQHIFRKRDASTHGLRAGIVALLLGLPLAAYSQGGTAERSLPDGYGPGQSFTVPIEIDPAPDVAAYAVEEQPPAGWEVSEISQNGVFDDQNDRVKWGPFFEGQARTLEYTVTPSPTAAGSASFAGTVSFDGSSMAIGGDQQVGKTPETDSVARRELPSRFRPGDVLQVSIQVEPASDVASYAVEEQPPEGWQVSEINHEGAFDAESDLIRWGPFFDNEARELTYRVTPSPDASESARFEGIASFDGVNVSIQGARESMVATPPELDISLQSDAGEVTLNWKGGGTLQTSDSILGPWSDAEDTSSPAEFSIVDLPLKFFRIVPPSDGEEEVPETLPVYTVEDSGLTTEQRSALAESLGMAPEDVRLMAGAASFIDPREAMAVPKKTLASPQTFEDEDRGEVTVETGIDLEAVAEMKVPPKEEVVADFRDALDSAGLMPGEAFPGSFEIGTSQATLGIYGMDASKELEVPLNTRVGISPMLEGRPYIGAGAVIAVSYTMQDGQPAPSRLTYAWRRLSEGEEVAIIDKEAARARCRRRLEASATRGGEISVGDPKLVYYAPPLESQNASKEGLERETPVEAIVPHYTCGGTLTLSDGTEASLSEVVVPAVEGLEYRPEASLQAELDGRQVSASVSIEGDRGQPYTVEWSSTHASLGPSRFEENATEISYEIDPNRAPVPETLTVHVRDANGVLVTASQELDVSAGVEEMRRFRRANFKPAVGGTTDFGSEGAGGGGWYKAVNDKFENVMRNQGVTERFVWDGDLAWEDDFHDPDDATWADNADVTLYSGHGWWGGFTFHNTSHSDGGINWRNDARGDWGDKDLEWLAILSCNVLDVDGNGDPSKHVVNRWTDEFDGIHAVLGFHTLANLWDNMPKWFARGMTKPVSLQGRTFQRNVRQAWFEAIEKTQAFREGVAMGPISESGALTVSDYFWGRGNVGPDIPSDRIDKIWLVREGSYYHYNP